jgi:hypothetical protein
VKKPLPLDAHSNFAPVYYIAAKPYQLHSKSVKDVCQIPTWTTWRRREGCRKYSPPPLTSGSALLSGSDFYKAFFTAIQCDIVHR